MHSCCTKESVTLPISPLINLLPQLGRVPALARLTRSIHEVCCSSLRSLIPSLQRPRISPTSFTEASYGDATESCQELLQR